MILENGAPGISGPSNFGQRIIVECIMLTGIWPTKSNVAWARMSHLREQIVGVESSQLNLVFDPVRLEGGRVDLPSATGEDKPCGAVLV